MLTANGERFLEEFALHGIGIVYLLFHADKHLFPESRNRAHAGGMRFAHTLLYFLRIGVDNQLGTLGQTKNHPATLEDMCKGKEIHDSVLLSNRHTLVVSLKGGMILSVGQHDSFRVACGSAGIKDISQVIETGLLIQSLDLRLAWKALAQFQEIVKEDCIRVVGINTNTIVKHDDALQCRTKRENSVCLVILLLLSNKQEPDIGIANHVLHLLLTTGGIKRNGNSTNAICAKIGVKILHRVLREHTNILLYSDTQIEQCIRHNLHHSRKVIPRSRLPLQASKVAIVQCDFLSIFLCLLMNEHRHMTIVLHRLFL